MGDGLDSGCDRFRLARSDSEYARQVQVLGASFTYGVHHRGRCALLRESRTGSMDAAVPVPQVHRSQLPRLRHHQGAPRTPARRHSRCAAAQRDDRGRVTAAPLRFRQDDPPGTERGKTRADAPSSMAAVDNRRHHIGLLDRPQHSGISLHPPCATLELLGYILYRGKWNGP